jgi:hypothetical protein
MMPNLKMVPNQKMRCQQVSKSAKFVEFGTKKCQMATLLTRQGFPVFRFSGFPIFCTYATRFSGFPKKPEKTEKTEKMEKPEFLLKVL